MNLRKDNNGKALAEWKKLGIGLIQKPLRHIRNRRIITDRRENIIASYEIEYQKARLSAKRGDGEAVMRIARSIRFSL